MSFRIEIKHQLILFSTHLKTTLIVPESSVIATIYPGYLEFCDLLTQEVKSIQLSIQGPVSNFSIKNIVSKRMIEITFHDQMKFFRYHLFCEEGLVVFEEKKPTVKRLVSFAPSQFSHTKQTPRLFLGSTKSQDLEAIWKRKDLKEIFPYLLAFSAQSPRCSLPEEESGTYLLLKKLKDQTASKLDLEAAWMRFLSVGFYEMFVPTANDLFHQGCIDVVSRASPLPILSEMESLISSLFITYEAGVVTFLPKLFNSFICGKLTHVEFEFGRIDFEWTKKMVRRIVIYSKQENVLTFRFPKGTTKYRLMIGRQKKKSRHQADHALKISPGCEYRLEIE